MRDWPRLGGLADPFANQSGASDSFVLGQLAAVDGGDDVDDRNAFCDAALVLLDADFAVAFADLGALALQPLASEIVDGLALFGRREVARSGRLDLEVALIGVVNDHVGVAGIFGRIDGVLAVGIDDKHLLHN